MGKRYRRLLALWSLAALLLTGLLSGCSAGTQNDRKIPAAAVGDTEGAAQAVGGGADETERTAVGKAGGNAGTTDDETDKTAQKTGSETVGRPMPEAEEDKAKAVLETSENVIDAVLPDEDNLPEDGSYTTKEDVALYLYTYGHLPDNFIRKNDAKKLGWDNSKGNLAEVAPGKSIGGDRFGNYEGLLPEEDGRTWTECDIGYEEGYRNGERIVFSNDGLIYYTGDHYKSFERLY